MNSGSGILLLSSKNNIIYNNFFNNTNNFGIISSVNRWNTTKTPGINIIGGSYLGGNVWANPKGTEFSETCTDSNSDGICDSSYTMASKNADYLPLAYKPSIPATIPPAIKSFAPDSPLSNVIGAKRAFNITLNQIVNITWYLNGTPVQFNESVTTANYTNTSAAAGRWNVNATGSNSNGTASQIWEWIVGANTPGTPTNLANTTGTFWVNHTWSSGANTDSFNVSVNGNWDNGSSLFRNTTSLAHGWVNITVAGYNSASHLLSGFVSQDTRIPNNPISIKDIQDSYSLNEGQTLTIDANYTDVDNDPETFDRNFSQGTFDTSTGILSWTAGAGDAGVHSWQINVTDGYGSLSTKEFTVTVVVGISPPNIVSFAPPSPVSNVEGDTRIFNITANQIVNVTWYINGTEVFDQSSVTESSYTNTSAAAGIWVVNATANNSNGTVSKEWIWNVTAIILPPDPSTVAPPLDLSVATNVVTATEFLYTGSNPIQTGVAPGTIEAKRVVVLRGRVLNREGAPLSGVSISILSHPEFGSTQSRADGMFDMAVNGGGLLTVNYDKVGYLIAQRQIHTPWQDYAWLPDVVMIQADTNVTAVNLFSNATQVARGSVVNDSDGARQATLLFPQGIQANMTLQNGTMQSLTSMQVRATEYTVGANGPKAMPAQLPPTSGYTYAVELSVDEAGAKDVSFDRPVYIYVENFLNFSTGSIVPSGYYNRSLGQWIASNNGLVIRILGITNGMADLDVKGNNLSANASVLAALNITDAERQQLAALYQPNQSLWRVPITHFSPWDCNWPYGPPPSAVPPGQPVPRYDRPPDDPDCQGGSIIGCQNQELGESVDVAGTPFSLHYQSTRVPGHMVDPTLEIPLSGTSVPASLKNIDLKIFVAGRDFTQSFPAAPNQSYTFTWDGRDSYGRKLQGVQPITVNIGYVYGAVYMTPAQSGSAFAGFGDSMITGSRARQEVTLWQKWQGSIGSWDARSQGLGGWSLGMHHAYDSQGRVLYSGNGGKRSANAKGIIITTIAGNGNWYYDGDGGPATQASLYAPEDVAVGQDGSIYIATNYRIRKVGPDGIITTVAGNGFQGYSGDGGPATQASLFYPQGVAVGPDNSIYIADTNRIRKVGPDGIITTIAGNGSHGYSGDGGPATQASFIETKIVAVGQDGSIYISDGDLWNSIERIRKVGPDGIITTVAGSSYGYSGDGGPATQARLGDPQGIAVDQDGSIYIADKLNYRIRKVGPNGIITTVAGNGFQGYSGDGGPATQARLYFPSGVSVGQDGSIYIADFGNSRIRKVGPDGIITTIAGNGFSSYGGDGGPATQARLYYPQGVSVGQDGSIYIADTSNGRIRHITPSLPEFSMGDLIISSEDSSEIYIFNSNGRHLRTLNALTGSMLYQFAYDNSGRLSNVTDGDNNTLTIERDADGNATAIISPYGKRTSLSLDANGYLSSITNPAGESTQFSYTADGLLTSMINPGGHTYNYGYDTLGRLIRDEDPAGGFKTLERTDMTSTGVTNGYSVKLATGLNRNTTYQVELLSTGDQRHVNIFPDGLKKERRIGTNGSETDTYPDGTRTTLLQGPDPRFGMQAPVAENFTIITPHGLAKNIKINRTMTLANPNDPLRLQNLTETMSINGLVYTSIFNSTWKNITIRTAMGRTAELILNNKSQIIKGQIPGNVTVNFTYDARGRPDTISQGTRAFSFSYDAQGNLLNVTDALFRTLGFEYDPAGRVTGQILPDGRKIQFDYDPGGNIIAITPPGRPDHVFSYTPVDLIKDYMPPDAGIGDTSTHYTYNIDRQLTNITRPDGAKINIAYDSAGRMSTVNYPQGTTSLSYNNVTGKLKEIIAPDGGNITYAYDGSLLTDTTWSGAISGSIHRTHDNNFSITSESINGINTVNFQYNMDGLLTQAGNLNLSRDLQNGMLSGTTLGKITDNLSYNGFGEVAAYQAAYSGAGIFAVNYTRDDLGRIVLKNETVDGAAHTYAYMYDKAGRLTNVSKDGVIVSRYVYDSNGNRLSYTGSGSTINGSYDNQDRLLQYGTTTYTYTASGELLRKTNGIQTTTYQYDALGNLRNVTLPDGTKIEHIIDGQNRRIGKKVNGILVQGFLYKDRLRPIAELDGAGNVVSRFVYADASNVPNYMIKGGNTYRIIKDRLGSPRLMIDITAGTVVQRMDYDEFGNVLADTSPGFQPFGFGGGIYDQNTMLVHFGARDYDAQTGRWTTKDPILFAGGNANLYGYVINDPINLVDPSGLLGVGLVESFSAEIGLIWGAGVTESIGGGIFAGGEEGVNLGGFLSGGEFIKGPGFDASLPGGNNENGENFAVGGTVGVGAGVFITNAVCAGELKGPFNTYSFNSPILSAQFGASGGIWIYSVTMGPSIGIGSISGYPTTAITTGSDFKISP